MSVKRILELGDPLLRQQCDVVENPTSSSVAEIAGDLKDTLEQFQFEHGWGRGIAAPQIGCPIRLIVVGGASLDFSAALVNPRILNRSEKRIAMWDGCFSFPGLVVGLWRAAEITVGYTELHGAKRTISTNWILSQLLQHEIDHLDGVLAVQRAISPQHILTREEWQRRGRPEYVDMTESV
jgi:peptide deformylase